MNKYYFGQIPTIGDLILEKVLFSFENIPIVFVCMDKSTERYLCICDDIIESESWIITKVTTEKLLEVLYDKIPVCKAFETSGNNTIIADIVPGSDIKYTQKDYIEIDELELPDKTQYLEMKEHLEDYIKKLENELLRLANFPFKYTSQLQQLSNTSFQINTELDNEVFSPDQNYLLEYYQKSNFKIQKSNLAFNISFNYSTDVVLTNKYKGSEVNITGSNNVIVAA